MRCSHCHSLMYVSQSMRDLQTEQIWYECPTCGRTHLYSERLRGGDGSAAHHPFGTCAVGEPGSEAPRRRCAAGQGRMVLWFQGR
jgi:hypothetical protein